MADRILVIDDDAAILESCQTILEDEGHEVETVADGRAGLRILEKGRFALALIDLRMPGMSGIEFLERAARIDPALVLIIFTAYGSIESAVEAIKKSAFNYITKPFTAAQLATAVAHGLEHRSALHGDGSASTELVTCCPLHEIVGNSPALQVALATAAKVARSEADVLVTGESGTGKELIARALHANSTRRDGPFVAVDCAALPANLLESELFGYEKGAFTGASQSRPGHLELAEGGTLFLDEIGELPPELQAKLLRTIQERSFRRLGAQRLVTVNVRIISSTNRDLHVEVRQGRFRLDLLYRIDVVTILLPPLRERAGDVRFLTDHFLEEFTQGTPRKTLRIASDVLRLFERYPWPGNVRELRNAIERAVILSEGDIVQLRDLPEYMREGTNPGQEAPGARGYKAARRGWVESHGKQYLIDLLQKHDGNIAAVAREAQISRKSVYALMGRLGIDARKF